MNQFMDISVELLELEL